ncbi:receptor-type tyrosine-protein phosphatase F-like [Salvelinus sp. IW2-2015]|nr:receptor-type tyrosine-protein phosphatase F-like [Salvelinus alpinus]
MDLEELLESGEGPVLRRRRQVEPTRPYIAAKLPSLPATFTLGDEKNYNGFYNRPLPGHQHYQAFVLAALKEQEEDNSDKHRTFSASPYSDPIQVSPNVSRTVEQPEMLWVLGPVLAVVLIIVIVIAILLFKR